AIVDVLAGFDVRSLAGVSEGLRLAIVVSFEIHYAGECVVDPRFDVLLLEIVVTTPSHAFKYARWRSATGVLRHKAAIHRPRELACTRRPMRWAVGVRPKFEGVVPLADFHTEHFVMIVGCRVRCRLV